MRISKCASTIFKEWILSHANLWNILQKVSNRFHFFFLKTKNYGRTRTKTIPPRIPQLKMVHNLYSSNGNIHRYIPLRNHRPRLPLRFTVSRRRSTRKRPIMDFYPGRCVRWDFGFIFTDLRGDWWSLLLTFMPSGSVSPFCLSLVPNAYQDASLQIGHCGYLNWAHEAWLREMGSSRPFLHGYSLLLS